MWPNTTEKVYEVWNNHTYSKADLFNIIIFGNSTNHCHLEFDNNTTTNTEYCNYYKIDVSCVSTFVNGNCYSLKVPRNISGDFILSVLLKSQNKVLWSSEIFLGEKAKKILHDHNSCYLILFLS